MLYLIKFSLFYKAQYHNLRICHSGLYNPYPNHHPVPGPHIRSGNPPPPPPQEKTFTGKTRKETFRRATEEDPFPGWTEAVDVMCTEHFQ